MVNSKKIIGFSLPIILLVVGVLFYTGMIGHAPKQVIIIIEKGSGENLHLGFEPTTVTLVIGINNTITWKNQDTDWHTAHSNLPEFDSGLIQSGASYTHVFERSGTYPYHCDPHPWMTGIVIVRPSSLLGTIRPDIRTDLQVTLLTVDVRMK